MRAVPLAVLIVALSGCKDNKSTKAKATDQAPSKAEPAVPALRVTAKGGHEDVKGPKAGPQGARTWTFDDKDPLTDGFAVAETGSVGTPATWARAEAPDAPSPPSVFGVTKTENPKTTYNLAVFGGVSTADVDISVMVKAVSGKLDQGGGPVFRYVDADNYYIARWNPLENNVRFYIVTGGVRSALGKTDVELDAAEWHSLRVVAEGSRMELFVDDKPMLTVEDETHPSGAIGLWTKADAATLFDDLSIVRP